MDIINDAGAYAARRAGCARGGASPSSRPWATFTRVISPFFAKGAGRAICWSSPSSSTPTQFGQGEDFDVLPPRPRPATRRWPGPKAWTWCSLPKRGRCTRADYATYVNVEGLTETLCGASRPGHFRGVTTVVAKLFAIVLPHVALFGRKDFQQLAVIRRMAADLNLPVEIVGIPIVRETDGLAMSSRNVYLSPEERRQALALSRALEAGRKMAADGERDAGEILSSLSALIEAEPDARIDYLQICDQHTLRDQERVDVDSVLLMAVFVGKTRLLDNGFLLP